jgi:hypothetical protein
MKQNAMNFLSIPSFYASPLILSTAVQAAAASAAAVSLQTGRAMFFARGVLHEATVSANDPGRYSLI